MKHINVFGLLAGSESSYGAGGALVAGDDGVELSEPAQLQLSEAHDGDRGTHPTGGARKRGEPSGRVGSGDLPVELHGLGIAYSGTDVPPAHVLLLAAGHKATLDSTVDAETYTYTPIRKDDPNDELKSLVAELYTRGMKYPLVGGLASFSFVIENGGFVDATFGLRGLVDAKPTDVDVPDIEYPGDDVLPPKGENISLDIGGYADLIVKRVEFDAGREEPGERLDMNAADAHAGFIQQIRSGQLVIDIEAPDLSNFDPFADYEAATEQSISFNVDGGQYNKIELTAGQAQLAQYPEDQDLDGDLAGLRLTYQLNKSAADSEDDYSLVYS